MFFSGAMRCCCQSEVGGVSMPPTNWNATRYTQITLHFNDFPEVYDRMLMICIGFFVVLVLVFMLRLHRDDKELLSCTWTSTLMPEIGTFQLEHRSSAFLVLNVWKTEIDFLKVRWRGIEPGSVEHVVVVTYKFRSGRVKKKKYKKGRHRTPCVRNRREINNIRAEGFFFLSKREGATLKL